MHQLHEHAIRRYWQRLERKLDPYYALYGRATLNLHTPVSPLVIDEELLPALNKQLHQTRLEDVVFTLLLGKDKLLLDAYAELQRVSIRDDMVQGMVAKATVVRRRYDRNYSGFSS